MKTTNLTFMEAITALNEGHRIGIKDLEANHDVELTRKAAGTLYWKLLNPIDGEIIETPHHISIWDVVEDRYYIIDPSKPEHQQVLELKDEITKRLRESLSGYIFDPITEEGIEAAKKTLCDALDEYQESKIEFDIVSDPQLNQMIIKLNMPLKHLLNLIQ